MSMEARQGPSKETNLKDEPDVGQEFLTILSLHNFLSLIPDLEKVLLKIHNIIKKIILKFKKKIYNLTSGMLSELREATGTCLGPSSRAVSSIPFLEAGEVGTVAVTAPLYPGGM